MTSQEGLDGIRPLVRAIVGDGADTAFGAYLLAAGDPASAIARHVEREVFFEAFDNGASELEAEYGPYEATSVFYVVIDHSRGMPAGAMRLIANPPGGPGLKSWVDLPRFWSASAQELLVRADLRPPDERTWEIATLAVAKGYQSALGASLVSLGLYQSVVRSCMAIGVEHLVAVLDSPVYRITRARYAEPFVPYGPPRPYLGSRASHPVYCSLSEWEARLRLVDPELHAIIYEGRGLEVALSPLDPDALAGLPVVPITRSLH